MAYITPPLRATGDLVTAAIWNQDVRNNFIAYESHAHTGSQDGSSAVITPQSFMGYIDTSQNIANNTWTAINWINEEIDSTGMHSTATESSRIFIKSPGQYLVTAVVRFKGNSSGKRGVRIFNNYLGSEVYQHFERGLGTTIDHDVTVACVTPIATTTTGDYLMVQAFQDTGTTVDAMALTGWAGTMVNVVRIGKSYP